MSSDAQAAVVHALDVLTPEGQDVLLDTLASGVDTVITDPPFSPHVHESAQSTGTGGRGPSARYLGFEPITPELRATIATCAAAASRWAIVHADFEGVPAWLADMSAAGVEWIRLVPWCRWSQPQISGDRPGSQAEAVLHFHGPGKKRWNGPGGLMSYGARSLRGRHKHPTEKPIDLALDLVSYYSDPGELILDPCAGRGTTGVAAALLGRRAVLFERDATFAEQARVRCMSRLEPRDQVRTQEWAARVAEEAAAELGNRSGSDGSKRRAASRLRDSRSVLEAVSGP